MATIRSGGAMRRLAAAREGSSLAEFALIVPLLLLIVTAVLEFGMVMFVVTLAEGALRDAARWGVTGQDVAGMSRLERIVQLVGERTFGLVDMADAAIEVRVYPNFGSVGQGESFIDGNANGAYDVGETFTDLNGNGLRDADIGTAGAGGAGDVVVYRFRYDWPLLTPFASHVIGEGGKIAVGAAIAVRNEPWASGGGT